jgi:A/G-specific adenine glycosylase
MIPDLLTWFVDRRRDLPWRRVADPYATWVSEIMLQQTRVEAVIPYFERWMARFPDVHALAAASEEEVLQHWAGLGYYRRARFLHQAAQSLVKESKGALPETSVELRKMTGVGEYTSAAIASICFDEAIPVVDGNVKRVAARVLLMDLAANDRKLHRAAEDWGRELMAQLVAADSTPFGDRLPATAIEQKSVRAGALNEALMELGATICTPRSPLCGQCPIQSHCQADNGDVDPTDYPRSAKRTPWKELHLNFVWHQDGPLCLLQQRTEGWNPGLWEPPTIEQGVGEEICQVKHTITHHKITARVFKLLGPVSAPLTPPDAVPLTGLARKILAKCWKAC